MKTTDQWITKFKKDVLPVIIREYKPEIVICFGSRIRGNCMEDSDLDVIVVSRFFQNIPFLKRAPLVLKSIRFEKHIDFLCYSPEEFERNKNNSIVIEDALTYGEWLKVA